eukprot:1201674-Pyramimonas_sp.AAC.1
MTLSEWKDGLGSKPQDGGMDCRQIDWEEWTADKSFMPHLYGTPELAEHVRQDRAGQITYLRRAPKRRAGPAWGVLAEALCMGIDARRYTNEHDR